MIKKEEGKIAENIAKEVEKDIDNEFKREVDSLSKVTFLGDLLDKQNEIRNMLDVRSNIVIGFNSALIVIFVTSFHDTILTNPAGWLALGVLVASLLCAIVALKPPHYSTKKGQAESIFYHHYIDSKELLDYEHEIQDTLKDDKRIYAAYIQETYNLTRYSNIP